MDLYWRLFVNEIEVVIIIIAEGYTYIFLSKANMNRWFNASEVAGTEV